MERKRMSLAMVLTFLGLTALVLALLGYLPGSQVGETTGVVTWSQADTRWKGEPYSKLRVRLSSGKEIYTTAARTPPPAKGEVIVLKIRRNILGANSYTWVVGQPPAP